MGALLSFLGGSAFRVIWGELSAYFTAKQNHKYELERMALQQKMDDAEHTRNMEAIRVQAEMQVKVVQVASAAAISKTDADAWAQAVADVGKSTGIKFLDVWNGSIRPYLATLATVFLMMEAARNGWGPTEHILIVCDAILGVYVADRTLGKRGK